MFCKYNERDGRSKLAPKKKEYTNDSITALKGADRVRLRPAVIFGSDGLEGCEHSVFEIISNSVDEAREGYGDKIIVTRYSDGSIEVEDFGRGIPVDYNKNEQRYNWELLYCELYAGGKYGNDADNYEFSLGLNGLGLCSTQYASEYMDVESRRDGKRYTLHFERGENVGGLHSEDYSGRQTGTKTRWKPDSSVFTETAIPLEYFQLTLKRQAAVNEDIKFILRDQNGKSFDTYEYYYKNGIVDYLGELAGNELLTPIQVWQTERVGRDRADRPDYKVKIKAAVAFSNKIQFKECYHNSSWLEYGGAPDKAVRTAFVSQIDAYMKANGKYQKNESKISFQDVEDCLLVVISSSSTVTSYENQTKKAINNKFIQECMTDFFRHSLEVYFIENKADADKICDQILINKRSRERSERERLSLKKTLQSANDLTNRVQKFVDCRSKDISQRELFIVEGDSALGSVKHARDPEYQAVIPVRGKILNCNKAEFTKIFKNEIITDLIKVMGCGVEVPSKTNKGLSTFNLDNLQWNKIIICTDADVDGYHIRTLILAMFYRLTPTLINEGKIYIAETPLYEIHSGKDTYFAYSDAEKASILKGIGRQPDSIQRSKGLGENEPEMMNLTTMNPATRRLIKVMPDVVRDSVASFDLFLGDDLDGRKRFISENGSEFIELADIS